MFFLNKNIILQVFLYQNFMVTKRTKFLRKRLKNLTFLINIFLLFLQIEVIFCGNQTSCYKIYNLTNKECFNDRIILANKFRAGHFVTTKDGSLIIEYSNAGPNYLRLFYGLKKNGRYYFENETPFRHFNATNPVNKSLNGRYESKNIVLHFKNDTSKKKEYIFSTSIWTTVTELHDLETGISKYWDTSTFWDIIEIFSYEINLFELKEGNKMNYVCAFTQREKDKRYLKNGKEDIYSKTFSLRKFSFTDLNNYTILGKLDYKENYNSRMISCFLVPEFEDIVVFFLKAVDNEYKNAKYYISFYQYNLDLRNSIEKDYVEEPNSGEGIFFRGFYLHDRWCAFIYFKDRDGKNLQFEIGQLVKEQNGRAFNYRIQKTFSEDYYAPHVNYNDFFKVDNNRIVFVTTKNTYNSLYFIIFDLFNDYKNFIARK